MIDRTALFTALACVIAALALIVSDHAVAEASPAPRRRTDDRTLKELEERAQDVDASDDPQMVRPAPPEKRASFAKDTMDRLGNSLRNEASRRKSRTWQLNDLEGNKALLMRQDSDWVS